MSLKVYNLQNMGWGALYQSQKIRELELKQNPKLKSKLCGPRSEAASKMKGPRNLRKWLKNKMQSTTWHAQFLSVFRLDFSLRETDWESLWPHLLPGKVYLRVSKWWWWKGWRKNVIPGKVKRGRGQELKEVTWKGWGNEMTASKADLLVKKVKAKGPFL